MAIYRLMTLIPTVSDLSLVLSPVLLSMHTMISVLQKWLKRLATWQMQRSTWLAQIIVSFVQLVHVHVLFHIAFGQKSLGYEY